MKSARQLTLIDMMATVAASGLALAWLIRVAPGRVGPTLGLVGPVLGILWHRRRGGRGILGGALGGVTCAAIDLPHLYRVAKRLANVPPWTRGNWDDLMFALMPFVLSDIAFGAAIGVAAWLVAAAMGRPRTPDTRATNE